MTVIPAAVDVQRAPVRVAMGQMAAAIRMSVSVVAIAAAFVGAVPPVSLGHLVPTLAIFTIWSGVYVWHAWVRGLSGWMLGVDLAVVCWLCIDLGALVPPGAQARGTSWVVTVAGMVVICAQLNGGPLLSIPGGFLVAASFVSGSRLAGVADGGTQQGITLGVQTLAAAGCMVVATRTGRATASALARLQATERVAAVRRAQHEDELSQLRILHNGVLTTLTMAAQQGIQRPTLLLRQRAAADLSTLPSLSESAEAIHPRTLETLHARLAKVVARYSSLLRIDLDFTTCELPVRVGQAFAEATSEALENIARHAETDAANIALSMTNGHITVVISDQGCGFDTAKIERGFGMRESIIGCMRGIGGDARITSSPGVGTAVLLEWSHD